MDNRFCRICWNTSGWRIPTGDRIEFGKSYVAKYGFGHEEWLFNYEWMIDGFRYGFLQPIGKLLQTHAGHQCSITLYTLTPEKQILLIGTLTDAYIPELNELQNVLDTYRAQGWLDQMREQVRNVGGDIGDLENPSCQNIANIRFRPEDVTVFDPRPRVIGGHTIVNNLRYQPFKWIGNFPDTDIQPPQYEGNDPRRSEHERTRAAQEGSAIDPRHTKLQNLLWKHLRDTHGPERVHYEKNYVDLSLSLPDKNVFFEIKMESSAKRCIRLAFGQLLEYSHYPNVDLAQRLVVVGDAPVTDDDKTYLVHLRETYNIPIYYSHFLWEKNELSPPY